MVSVMNRKITNLFASLLGLLLFLVALWFLHHALSEYHYSDIAEEARSLPALRLIAALLLTTLNYLVLTGYDVLAFRYVGRTLEYGRIAFASFIGYAFSNNIGLSMLAGSSVRYRLYTSWGLSMLDVTKMVAFSTLTLWLGLLSIGGIAFVVEPVAVPVAAETAGRFRAPAGRPLSCRSSRLYRSGARSPGSLS